MQTLSGNTIYITRGDTLDLSITIYDQNGEEYTPEEGAVIRFAMKKKYTDTEPLIKKVIPISTMKLRIEADEMKAIPASRTPYVYDVELTLPDGTVDTFIDRQNLYVTEEVD